MTNSEAQAYAIVALYHLIKIGEVKVKNKKELLNKLDSEMYYLMDNYSEDEIVKKMERIMSKEE